MSTLPIALQSETQRLQGPLGVRRPWPEGAEIGYSPLLGFWCAEEAGRPRICTNPVIMSDRSRVTCFLTLANLVGYVNVAETLTMVQCLFKLFVIEIYYRLEPPFQTSAFCWVQSGE